VYTLTRESLCTGQQRMASSKRHPANGRFLLAPPREICVCTPFQASNPSYSTMICRNNDGPIKVLLRSAKVSTVVKMEPLLKFPTSIATGKS
jgi:hypothetical protein